MAVRISAEANRYRATIASPPTSNQWSVAFWIKPVVATGRIWSLNNASTGADEMLFSETGEFRLIAGDTGHTGPAAAAGVWHYVGYSNNGVNGIWVIRTLTATSFTVLTWSDGSASSNQFSRLALGDHYEGGVPMDGSLAAFRWWSASLSQAELEAECFRQMPSRTAGLRGWYPLIRTTDLADLSGNGNTLTGGTGAAQDDGPGIPWRQGHRRIFLPGEVPAEATPPLITGVASVPTPAISLGRNVAAPLIGGTSSVPTPSIFVGGGVTPVEAPRIVGTAAVPAPDVSTVKNVAVAAPLIAARALVPAPTVSVPVNPGDDLTGHGELSYNGFKLSAGTYTLMRLTGTPWDMAPLDNGDVPHPSAHGALAGQKLAQERIVTAEFQITCPNDTEAAEAAALAFLDGLPVPDADEQLPIAIQIYNTVFIGYGACINRDAPVEQLAVLGFIPASAQFAMADPRFYSRQLLSATVPDGGDVDVNNAGNTPTRPLIRIPGPANQPLIEITRMLPDGTEDVRVLEYDVEIPAGQALVIDVALGTVALGEVNESQARTNQSVSIPDMVLGKGISTIAYESETGSAPPAVVLWKHAYL
ncbi:hypothetical protein ACIBG7_15275 [Nonomuraea sp. NPDC050328]|uniref:hypothetical protein n=1 Tax=Nonomuraea sp. NPDC050328 TaxID=3364361 RepID=UPI0037BB3A4D